MFSNNNSICQNKSCQDEILELKNKITEHENEIKEKKDVYRRALIRNFGLDCMIEDLEEQLEKGCYQQFESQISKATIKLLQSIPLSKSNDCKFVTAVLRDLYAGNIEVLKTTSATGRGADKLSIPDEKYGNIRKIFDTRMEYASKYASDDGERRKNLNKCIKSAIETINRSML